MEHTITAEKRTAVGSNACKAIRAEGKMPAVLYGEGKEAVMVTLNTKEFERIWRIAGESTVLNVTGLGKDVSVLIQDVTLDPYYDVPTHADFYLVRKDVVVDVEVPLVFVGVSPAEKTLGGTLIKVMHEIKIEALPKDLPSEVEVDISKLETFEDQIQIKDIVLPMGVTALDEGEEVVALVQEPKEEEEVREEVDLSAVEVVKKGKEVDAEKA
jgi:large subunit ribosomal protein L25